MAVNTYSIRLLNYDNCPIRLSPKELCLILKSWRNSHDTASTCSSCQKPLNFRTINFQTCCNRFYYKPTQCYINQSLAIKTTGFDFKLPNLIKIISKKRISSNQEFLIIPDPIFWQVSSTLVYEKTMKFVMRQPMTKKSNNVLPPTKSSLFYKQIQETPLNHGSIFKRSGGKNTFFRQIAFGKRCVLSTRAMIVPDAELKPNEITIPQQIQDSFDVYGKWIILNRMPSLQPENFVALRVTRLWTHDCFGIPLEIAQEMNADFDGDECNLYIIPNIQSQVECELILNSEANMGSFTLGLKLSPCQDMLVAYHLSSSIIDFLPYKNEQSLHKTFQTIYDLYGSRVTFECFDKMRQFYLDYFQNEKVFGISLAEIHRLVDVAESSTSFEEFERRVLPSDGCLVTQVKAEAKGSFFHLYQMFGGGSFWRGLTPEESVDHAILAYDGLLKSSNIWQPGYGYSKIVYNLQSLQIDYLGRLVDDTLILESDILNALHYTDLMGEDAFAELFRQEIANGGIK